MTPSLHSAEAVAAEIKARLQTLTVAQGAETDIGTDVHMGRTKIDDSMIPCTVVIEADDQPARGRVGTQYEVTQRYVLFAYLTCDPMNPNEAAHAAIRDMKRAVFLTNGKDDVTMGGKVREVRYLGRDIGPRADGAAFVVAAMEITAEYVERLAAP